MADPRFEPGAPMSEAELVDVERELGRPLPDVYRRFVKEYGGAFAGGWVDGNEGLSVLSFFGSEGAGVLSKLRLHADLRDEGLLPIAGCELNNLYVLDADDSVWYIDYYGRRKGTQKVSLSFQDFIDRIVVDDG